MSKKSTQEFNMDYTKLVQSIENMISENQKSQTKFLNELKEIISTNTISADDEVTVIVHKDDSEVDNVTQKGDDVVVAAVTTAAEPEPEPEPEPSVSAHQQKMRVLQEKLLSLKKK